jgi:predicted Zn finger-like uncharacterized protein
MYTQCPHCHAAFHVSAEQLKIAGGDVRCGQCLSIFNALDNLSEELPEDYAAAPAAAETSTEDPFAPGTTAPEHEQPAEHIEEAGPAAGAVAAEQASEEAPSPTADEEVPTSSANELGDIDSATAELETHIPVQDDEFEELAQVAAAQEPIIIEEADLVAAAESPAEIRDEREAKVAEEIILEATEPDRAEALEADAIVEPTGKPDTTDQTATEPRHNMPAVLLEDLHADKAAQLRPSNTPWVVGSLLLMLVLVTQVAYFQRDDLARDPQLRPWLEQLCELAGCELAKPYDIQQIEIIGRDVRSHPAARRALIASTTLINNAPFAQPYPLLTLTFSDITGTRLAQRRFTPREYLSADIDLQAGMPPNAPIEVELELVDPGKAAVNFEFHAEADPRAIRARS